MKRRFHSTATWVWLVGYLLATSTAALFHDLHAHGCADCPAAVHGEHAHSHDGSLAHDDNQCSHHHEAGQPEDGDEHRSSGERPTCAVCDYLAQASAPVVVVAAPSGSAEVRAVAEVDYQAPVAGVLIERRSRAPPVLA